MVSQTARKKRIALTSTIDALAETLPADARRLKQVLVNLLSNAVKFTPEGGKVGLEVQGDAEHDTLTLTVWDTGIGIADTHMALLFKPFVQIDSQLSRQYEGTGLGLALVLRLVQAHGGSVAVESTPGQGSRFSVILPWQPHTAAEPLVAASEPAFSPNLTVRSVLVIEDSATSAEQIERYLHELGIQVAIHAQASGAVARAAGLLPDLIILDVLLPDGMGWDVLHQLKNDRRTQAIPVLITSVIDDPERARVFGAAGFLLKPIDRAVFAQTLQRVASLAGQPAPAPDDENKEHTKQSDCDEAKKPRSSTQHTKPPRISTTEENLAQLLPHIAAARRKQEREQETERSGQHDRCAGSNVQIVAGIQPDNACHDAHDGSYDHH